MKEYIHILGASGSGTTTLARQLAKELGYKHLDTDAFYWEKTEPPFTTKNAPEIRIQKIREAMEGQNGWILSGSLCGWGDVFMEMFDCVIFLHLPHEIRMERLRLREYERYGDCIYEDGQQKDIYDAFMAWAATYDTAGMETRSLVLHEDWMNRLTCDTLRLEGEMTFEERVERALEHIRQ